MKKKGLCIPFPEKKDSSTSESSTPLKSPQTSTSRDSHSISDDPSLTQSKPAVPTYSGSSIQLLIQVDRKDIDVHFRLFINHKLAGKLTMQVDEFDAFITRISPVDIRDESIDLGAQYYAAIGSKHARRKLH